MAVENCLWGAPRIHGELLKLGFALCERTVSRYLSGRPRTRSQTWRTFFANHFGQTSIPLPVLVADADHEDIVADASEMSSCAAPSLDPSCARRHRLRIDRRRSLQLSSLDVRLGHYHVQDHTGAHKSAGRDPPTGHRHQPCVGHAAISHTSPDAFGAEGVWDQCVAYVVEMQS